jgi:hypothetical protein
VGCEENDDAAAADEDVDVAMEVVVEDEARGPSASSSDEYDVVYASDDEYPGGCNAGARDEPASNSWDALSRFP